MVDVPLKPCPFCGAEPYLAGSQGPCPRVKCRRCGAQGPEALSPLFGPEAVVGDAAVIDAWNGATRSPAAPMTLKAALKAVVEDATRCADLLHPSERMALRQIAAGQRVTATLNGSWDRTLIDFGLGTEHRLSSFGLLVVALLPEAPRG